MKTEWRIFGVVAAFLILTAGVYAWWTWYALGAIEWIGSIALLLSFALTGMCAWYFWVVSRRIEPRPEDRLDAEVSEGAGVVGFFSPGSYWPFGIALACAATGIGLVLWLWWLIIAGMVAVALSSSAMIFEYHTGTRRTATQ
jgi:hypothetical protein